MFLSSWFPWRLVRQHKGRSHPTHSPVSRRRGTRLALEQLENRTVPSNFTAATVSDLIADINLANALGGSNTITLVPGKTFTLTAVNNTTDGGNGLPVITYIDNLTIVGNGDTIARSTAAGTPAFRLFDVYASLTLENLTLTGGLAKGNGNHPFGFGGAILNRGDLRLSAVTVTGNSTVGFGYTAINTYGGDEIGVPGLGGGICSLGRSLTLNDGTRITNNSALGYAGGDGRGGGVYVESGTVTLTGVTVSSNTAAGGDFDKVLPFGGHAFGGGLDLRGASQLTLTDVTLSSNVARGGRGNSQGWGGNAYGGALEIAGGTGLATATLTSVTMTSNVAIGGKGGLGGGNAYGGALGIWSSWGMVTLTDSTLSSNQALGGGAQKAGGTPGSAYGGGVFLTDATSNYSTTLTLLGDSITGNLAKGGTAGKKTGAAQGGGIYVNVSAGPPTLDLDAFTLSHTTANSPDDIATGSVL